MSASGGNASWAFSLPSRMSSKRPSTRWSTSVLRPMWNDLLSPHIRPHAPDPDGPNTTETGALGGKTCSCATALVPYMQCGQKTGPVVQNLNMQNSAPASSPRPRIGIPVRLTSSANPDPRVTKANGLFDDIVDLLREGGGEPVFLTPEVL